MVRSHQRRLEQAKPFALLLAVATALALVSVAQGAAYLAYAGKPIPWAGMLKGRLTDWYLCALFVPLLYRLAVTRPIHRKSWVRVLPLHLGAGPSQRLSRRLAGA